MIAFGNRGFFVVYSLVIVAVLVDTSIRKVSPFTGGIGPEDSIMFIFLVCVYAVGQYSVLSFLASSHLHLHVSYKVIRIIQYVLLALLILIAFQIVSAGIYSSILMKTVIWINYAMLISLLGYLSYKCFIWSTTNKNRVIVAYAIAMAALSVSGIFTILYVNNALSGQRDIEYIRPLRSPISIVAAVENIFSSSYLASSVIAFILTWLATVLLLNHYSKKLGVVKYWILVLIPLVFFLSQFESVFLNILVSLRQLDPMAFAITYTLIFSATKPIGGILFGIAFWSVSRNIGNRIVKNYLMISAYGMILLFSTNQPVGLTLIPFPPFGLVTISFLGLASYLVFIGIFSASMSVALDSKLRTIIKKSALDETRFVETIGESEMEKLVERKVGDVLSRNQIEFQREAGIESSLTETEAKEYIKDVLDELKRNKH